jgi:ribosome-binding protein aMBF1 (putative translation factor)
MDMREEKGWSWEELSEAIGIDNTIFSKLKNKSRALNSEYEIKIKRFLSKYSKLPASGNITDSIVFEGKQKNIYVGDNPLFMELLKAKDDLIKEKDEKIRIS